MRNGFIAATVATAMALTSTGLLAQAGQVSSGVVAQSGQISGTAKDEAKKPYAENTVRVRDVKSGQIAGTTPLDTAGAFTVANLSTLNYLVELVNKDGKVVCTEGPFNLSQQPIKDGVVIDCNKIPAAYWIIGAASAAGITAGVVAKNPNSPAQ